MNTTTAKRGSALSSILKQLAQQGYREDFVMAFVPSRWTKEAEAEPGTLDHLKLSLAFSLGLDSAKLLRDGVAVPVMPSGMLFKRSTNLQEVAPPDPNLAYYSRLAKTIATIMEPSKPLPADPKVINAEILRESGDAFVSLENIIAYCWRRSIAVVYVSDIPLWTRGFDALVYPHEGRHVIFLARKLGREMGSRAAFMIAHELAHIALHHVPDNIAIVDDKRDKNHVSKGVESQADSFALDVMDCARYEDDWAGRALSPQTLAARAEMRCRDMRIDPGHLLWRHAINAPKIFASCMAALKMLRTRPDCDVPEFINRIARTHLKLEETSGEGRTLLDRSRLAA